jgi:hypothetical protein
VGNIEMKTLTKNRILVLSLVALVVLGGIFLTISVVIDTDDFDPEDTYEVNELTGEVTRITNTTPEKAGRTQDLIVYGYTDGLFDALSHIQRELFREQTSAYIKSFYGDDVISITIDPNTIEYIFPNDREELVEFVFIIDGKDDRVDTTIRLLGRVGLEITYENSNPDIEDRFTGPVSQEVETDFTGDGVPPEERGE